MADKKGISESLTPIPAITTIHSDFMSLHIAPEKLDGSNYSTWSRSVDLYVTSRGKMCYLTRQKKKPEEKDAVLYSTWVKENAMVKSWLLNSMIPEIRAIFLRLPTTHDV